jgi:hypothetical protein
VRDIDLLHESLALLVRCEQDILVIDDQFRQREPGTGIVDQKTVEDRLSVSVRVGSRLIVDQPSEKSAG